MGHNPLALGSGTLSSGTRDIYPLRKPDTVKWENIYSVKWDIILWLWEMGHYPLEHGTFTH